MTAQQAIKEINRQIDQLERESVKQIHTPPNKHINAAVSAMHKMIEQVKNLSGPSLESPVNLEIEKAIVDLSRQVEYLLKSQHHLPFIPSASQNPQDALMVYIELPDVEIGMWGLLFERLIRDRVCDALQEARLKESSWGFAAENFFYLVLIVSDKAKSVPVVTAELENLGILLYCQIGHYDGPDLRTLFSHGTLRPFRECAERVFKATLKGQGTLPGTEPPRRF